MRGYLGVARAPFLALPVTLVAAGGAAGAFEGAFLWSRTLLSLAGLVAAHIAVNAINEVSDFRSGIDLHTERTPFSGGSGTLPTGRLGVRAAKALAIGSFLVALGAGVWLTFLVGWTLAPVIALGAVSVLAYSNLFARCGVGEIMAGMGLGLLPIVATSMVQDGMFGPAAVAAGVPAFLMTFNLLLLNEFPDEKADRKGGRLNLVLALGRPAAAKVYVIAALLTPLSIAASVIADWLPPLALIAMAPSLLLVPPIRWALRTPHEPVPLPALGSNVLWNLATNSALALGLVLSL